MPPTPESILIHVVDDANRPLAVMNSDDVHAQGLRHKGFILLAWDNRNRIVLRRRDTSDPVHPGCLDVLGSGHVESHLAAEHAAENALPGIAHDLDPGLELLARLDQGVGTGRESVEIFGVCLSTQAVRQMEADRSYLLVDKDECLALVASYADRLTPEFLATWQMKLWPGLS